MSTLLHSVLNNFQVFIQVLEAKAGETPLAFYTFSIACILMCFSAWMDYRVRRFPNECYILLLITGILYSSNQGYFLAALAYFIATTILGMFLFPIIHLKAGDAKFLSVVWFFVNMNVNQSTEGLLFVKVLLIGMLLIGLMILLLYYKSPIKLFKQIKRDIFTLGLIATGQPKLAQGIATVNKDEPTIPLVTEFVFLYFVFLFLLGKGGGI